MQPQIMPAHERWVTAEEFSRIPNDDYHYELVEGRVVRVSPPGSRHAVLAMQIAAILHGYVMEHGLGRAMMPAGFTLARNPDTVREPDVAFVRQDRIPEAGIPDGYWPGPPDLTIEVRSPGDRPSEIRTKVDDYLARGVRLVWVVDPKKTVTTYAPQSSPVTLGVDDVLDAGDVVPGFTCPVGRIFD
jgi:Uma2 family endonuclease